MSFTFGVCVNPFGNPYRNLLKTIFFRSRLFNEVWGAVERDEGIGIGPRTGGGLRNPCLEALDAIDNPPGSARTISGIYHGNPKPSFLGVTTHILRVENLHFSWFWGPRVSGKKPANWGMDYATYLPPFSREPETNNH